MGSARPYLFPLEHYSTGEVKTEIQSGVYKDSVTVNLSAEDAVSGVNYTQYNLDGTGGKNYTGIFS